MITFSPGAQLPGKIRKLIGASRYAFSYRKYLCLNEGDTYAMREIDNDIRREGRCRLRALLPKALAAARRGDAPALESCTGTARALFSYLTKDNLHALEVYPGRLGGWQADLVFKGLPPGVVTRMGTIVSNPHETKKDAEAEGYKVLVSVLAAIAKSCPEARRSPRVFQLYNLEIELPNSVMQVAAETQPPFADMFSAQQSAITFLEGKLRELMPSGFSYEAFEALPGAAKVSIFAAAAQAASRGVVKYPMREALPPGSHQH